MRSHHLLTENKNINEILDSCIKNDRKAQEYLYKKFHGALWSICMRYITNKEEALEVLNDGYLKIFQNIKKFNENLSTLYTWMSRIMINTAIDFIRRKKTLKFTPVHELQAENEDTIDDIPDIYTEQQLVHFINQLPQTTKLVFNLYVVEGYTHEEIAGFLDITNSTSRWHVTEAKKRLRDIIKENGY
jgi:RNA polymerase sigma-70 factor (ECF subfamily)